MDSIDVLHTLVKVAQSLASMDGEDAILEEIVEVAMRLTNADAATLYVVDNDCLHFEILRNQSLGLHVGGKTGTSLPDNLAPISLKESSEGKVVLHVVRTGKTANIVDAYDSEFDFSGTQIMDAQLNYRSKSFLTVGMFNREFEPIGVLQLINAIDPVTGDVVAFSPLQQSLVEALAGMSGAILKNAMLHTDLSNLLDAFIKLIAEAVDAKSPYTGGHCRRVPDLVMDFAQAIHETQKGHFRDVHFTDADMHELHVAGWLHDIGKICIPEYVMDKATKLETIHDRIHEVRIRFQLARNAAEMEMWRSIALGEDGDIAQFQYQNFCSILDRGLELVERSNIGGEFMTDEDIAQIRELQEIQLNVNGTEEPLLSEDMVYNLCIRKGTLTSEERAKIQEHMTLTIQMLESLPFPKYLQRVPEFAGGHHETMIGTGYPKGLTKTQMSIQARMMAIADVFEALTAADRPYKEPKKLSEALRIMGFMKKDHHLDPELFDAFIEEEVYLTFAKKYMDPTLIDAVDKEALLAIVPKQL